MLACCLAGLPAVVTGLLKCSVVRIPQRLRTLALRTVSSESRQGPGVRRVACPPKVEKLISTDYGLRLHSKHEACSSRRKDQKTRIREYEVC